MQQAAICASPRTLGSSQKQSFVCAPTPVVVWSWPVPCAGLRVRRSSTVVRHVQHRSSTNEHREGLMMKCHRSLASQPTHSFSMPALLKASPSRATCRLRPGRRFNLVASNGRLQHLAPAQTRWLTALGALWASAFAHRNTPNQSVELTNCSKLQFAAHLQR